MEGRGRASLGGKAIKEILREGYKSRLWYRSWVYDTVHHFIVTHSPLIVQSVPYTPHPYTSSQLQLFISLNMAIPIVPTARLGLYTTGELQDFASRNILPSPIIITMEGCQDNAIQDIFMQLEHTFGLPSVSVVCRNQRSSKEVLRGTIWTSWLETFTLGINKGTLKVEISAIEIEKTVFNPSASKNIESIGHNDNTQDSKSDAGSEESNDTQTGEDVSFQSEDEVTSLPDSTVP
jgi:hypothetical protein